MAEGDVRPPSAVAGGGACADREPRPCGVPSGDSRRSAPRPSRPRRPARGRSAASRGKTRLHHVEIVQDGDHGAASSCQRRTRSRRSAVVLASMAVNGSSSRITPRVLQQQAGEQRALHLAARQGRDRAPLEAGQARRPRALPRSACRSRRADAAEQAGPRPQAHGDEIIDGERKAFGRDRRPAAGRRYARRHAPSSADFAAERPQGSDDSLEQGRLAGPVRADDRHQAAGRNLAGEMVHGRTPVVAERHVVEADGRCRAHVHLKREPQMTRSQSPARITHAPTRRSTADNRRSEKAGAAAAAWLRWR